MSGPLLSVRDLSVAFQTDDGLVRAVNGITFDLHPGETLAVVGESGSGKSVSAMAIMRLLPRSAQVSGSIEFEGRDLLGLSLKQMRKLQGNRVAMIFQDPMTALNPVFTVGNQLVEGARIIATQGTVTGGPVLTYTPVKKFPLAGDTFTYRVKKTADNLTALGTVTILPFTAKAKSYGGVVDSNAIKVLEQSGAGS